VLLLEQGNRMQQRLRAADREHRHHGRAAARRDARERRRQLVEQVLRRMLAVAIGRLDDHGVSAGWRLGRQHQQVVRAPEVAREQQPLAADLDQQAGRADDVTGRLQPGLPARQRLEGMEGRHGLQPLQAGLGIGDGVERQRGVVLGKAMPVGKGSVFFLDMARVGQQDLAQVARARCAPDPALEAFAHQQRQVAAVVEVGMGQHHRVDLAGCHRRRHPVAQPQLLVALEQPAVDQQALVLVLDEELGAGHGAGPAEEADLDAHAPISACSASQEKNSVNLSNQPLSFGLCLWPPFLNDSSSSFSSLRWCSVSLTGVSTSTWT
jgi:hypothetical protein